VGTWDSGTPVAIYNRHVADWIAIGISLVALGISVLAYWSGLPRLKVTASGPAMIVGADESWGDFPVGVTVTLTNDGGAPAQISRVLLGAEGVYGKMMVGPAKRFQLDARGGTAQWQYDYNDLRAQLGVKIKEGLWSSDEHLFVQASVRYGRKTKRSNSIRVNVPGDASARPPSRRERVERCVRSWTHPGVTFAPAHRIVREDVEARVARLEIMNVGRGRSKPRQLVAIHERADGTRELLDTMPPLHVPPIRGGRSVEVTPTFVDDSDAAPGDLFWWTLRDQRGRGNGGGIGATTMSRAPGLLATLAEYEAKHGDGRTTVCARPAQTTTALPLR
jgi:hypothetical protein